MKIIVFGHTTAEFSTESDLIRTLRSMGHEVTPLREGEVGTTDLLRAAHDGAEALLWLHTHGWDTPGLTRQWLEEFPIPTVGFTLDLFRGLARHDEGYVDNYPWFYCNYFFSADGSPESQEWFKAKGINHVWSPPGILHESCYITAPDYVAHPEPIIFVGSRGYHPEWPWRETMIRRLEETYGRDFRLYEHSSGMRGQKLNVLYRSAEVVVGDSCFADRMANYWSDRWPETLGRGGALVFPRVKGLPSTAAAHYEAGNFDSLKEAVDKVLKHGGWNSPHNRVRAIQAGHTYVARMQIMLDVVLGGGRAA